MRNFIILFLAFFFTLSAFANSESPTINPEPSQEVVLVSHVDFNKTLNMVMLDTEMKGFTVKLEDQNGNEIFRTQVRIGETEVMEIDLSDIEGGTYQLKVITGDQEQTESVIVPVG